LSGQGGVSLYRCPDITSYGKDLDQYDLSRLVKDLASIDGDFWIRLLYLYPTAITDELLETIAAEEKVCKYLDIPLQHTEQRILSLMKRGVAGNITKNL